MEGGGNGEEVEMVHVKADCLLKYFITVVLWE